MSEELRMQLADAIQEAITMQSATRDAIDKLFLEAACDTVEVTIDIKAIDRATLLDHNRNTCEKVPHHETHAVLCVKFYVDGKDGSERFGHARAPKQSYDYILITPSKDTPAEGEGDG